MNLVLPHVHAPCDNDERKHLVERLMALCSAANKEDKEAKRVCIRRWTTYHDHLCAIDIDKCLVDELQKLHELHPEVPLYDLCRDAQQKAPSLFVLNLVRTDTIDNRIVKNTPQIVEFQTTYALSDKACNRTTFNGYTSEFLWCWDNSIQDNDTDLEWYGEKYKDHDIDRDPFHDIVVQVDNNFTVHVHLEISQRPIVSISLIREQHGTVSRMIENLKTMGIDVKHATTPESRHVRAAAYPFLTVTVSD